MPLDGGGYAFAHGADSPWMAALQAVYACNHARSRGRLCRVVALDDRWCRRQRRKQWDGRPHL